VGLGALPGAVHDLTAARIWGIVRRLAAAGLIVLADKGYIGAGEPVLTPYRGRNKPPSQKAASATGDIDDEWSTYVAARREAQLNEIIEAENLRPDETRAFIDAAFRDGAIQTTGTAITKVLPPVSRFSASGGHGEKKQRVLTELAAFFERFFGLSATGGSEG
jgi:hypothetical protein